MNTAYGSVGIFRSSAPQFQKDGERAAVSGQERLGFGLGGGRRFATGAMDLLVGAEGFEPSLLSKQEPKSCVSASFTTRPECWVFNHK